MRKSAMVSVVLHVLTGATALLWLLWYFIPTGNVFNSLATLLIVILAGGLVWKSCRRREIQNDSTVSTVELPLLDSQGPVVLVCGDGLDTIFQYQRLRKTAQGWWLQTGDVTQLTEVARRIQAQSPRQSGQLSVMYLCQPDMHQDEAVLRSALKTLRQQIKQMSVLIGFTPPLVVSGEFSGPETPWVVVRGDKPVVCPINESPLAFIDWQQTDENVATLPVLSQAFSFIRATLLDELEKVDRLTPPVRSFAVTLRLGAANSPSPSIWSNWLYRRSCLQFPQIAGRDDPASRFPDAVLPLLAPFASPVPGGQRTRGVVWLMWLCALAALGFSALNNRALIHQVGADLQRWSAIPMSHYVPKAESLAALKQDALLLERWQRQGEPLRYSFGYYPGKRLWLALQQAIDTYLPPPSSLLPVEKETPQTVRLDALSLFETGKYQLKQNSTKMLVNALIDIKAKPGWLIVVAGHTDSTGDTHANHVLSLKRAEALRDWMISISDVSPTCFAVQGYGAMRPIATNDTVEGRETNRRVEISLVPQVDACKAPVSPDPSND